MVQTFLFLLKIMYVLLEDVIGCKGVVSSASVGTSMLSIPLLGHGEISGPSGQMTVGWTERWGKRISFGAF